MTEELKKEFSKLRFLDENGETYPQWEEKKLGDTSLINPPSDLPDSFEYIDLESVKKGQILETTTIKKEKAPSRAKRLTAEGDILYSTVRPYQMNNAFVGIKDSEKVASTGFALIRTNKNNPMFVYNIINSDKFYNKVEPLCTGGTYPAVNSNLLKNIKINLPSLPEQTKIAELLSNLDERIEAQSKLVELLKKQKQGYSQKIFNGSLRFKKDDGTDYDDWEEKKLGEIIECLNSKRKPLNEGERSTINGNIPYYGSTSIQGYINDYIFDEELVLLGEDAAPFYEFREKPIAQYVNEKCWVNNHVHVLRARGNAQFLFYSLVHKDVRRFVSSKSRGKLNQSEMVKIPIKLPSLPEQEKIAAFLSSLDNRIDEQFNKLEQLKQEKQAYMQRMLG